LNDCLEFRFEASRVQRLSEASATGSAAPRRRVPFLCLSKEKTPKERTPRRSLCERSPGGAPCSGGASTGRPCPDDACSTSCLAPRCARHPTRRFRRGPNSKRPQQKLPSPACGRGVGGEGRAQRGMRLPPVTSAPSSAARAVGRLARDGQSSAVTAGTPCRRDPEHVSSAGSPARAARRGADVSGAVLLVTFLGQARKVTRRRRAAEPVSAPPKVDRPSTPHRKTAGRSPDAWARCALSTLRAGRRLADTSSGEQRP